MLDCIPFTHYQYFCNQFSTSGQFTAVAKKYTCGSCGLTTWRFDTKKCVYMIDLLNDNHTQNGQTAIIKMLKLNFEQKTHSLGIYEYALLQAVVARRYNESRSTIVRIVERDNVIGTSINH